MVFGGGALGSNSVKRVESSWMWLAIIREIPESCHPHFYNVRLQQKEAKRHLRADLGVREHPGAGGCGFFWQASPAPPLPWGHVGTLLIPRSSYVTGQEKGTVGASEGTVGSQTDGRITRCHVGVKSSTNRHECPGATVSLWPTQWHNRRHLLLIINSISMGTLSLWCDFPIEDLIRHLGMSLSHLWLLYLFITSIITFIPSSHP